MVSIVKAKIIDVPRIYDLLKDFAQQGLMLPRSLSELYDVIRSFYVAYSEDQPVTPDTDAIYVQDRHTIVFTSDYPCINCGECVRICPARIQVHMLERFLEAGQYQEGADLYDLYSCVECGLCSFVCPSRIPVLQYIKLAKYELERATAAEEVNE